MPADFLSQNICSISSILDQDLTLQQSQDPFIYNLSNFIKTGTHPSHPWWAHYIKQIGPSCFFEDNILWRQNLFMQTIILCLQAMKASHTLKNTLYRVISGPIWNKRLLPTSLLAKVAKLARNWASRSRCSSCSGHSAHP